MTADLTREQAREQIARALAREFGGFLAHDPHDPQRFWNSTAAPILDVLWPEMDGLRRKRDEARGGAEYLMGQLRKFAADLNDALDLLAKAEADVDRLTAELAHAHTVIARHVEPLRKPCRPEAGDCCDGSAHTWQPAQGSRLPDRVDGNRPSDALCGDLTDFPCCSGGSGRVDETERPR